MKTVYCDVVFVTNFVCDFALLYLTSEFLCLKRKYIRMCMACVLAGVFAVLCAVFIDKTVVKLPLTVSFSPVMCISAFGKCKISVLIKRTVTLTVFGFILCGCVFSLSSLFAYDFLYGGISMLMMFSGVVMLCVAFSLSGRFFAKEKSMKKVRVKVSFNGVCKMYVLMCDSGNLLCDPYSSLPVIVLKKQESFDGKNYDEFIRNKVRYIPVKTAQGNGVMKAMKPESVELLDEKGATQICAVVGFSENSGADFGGADGIIPACLLENI